VNGLLVEQGVSVPLLGLLPSAGRLGDARGSAEATLCDKEALMQMRVMPRGSVPRDRRFCR
jgi:hypothetical protein